MVPDARFDHCLPADAMQVRAVLGRIRAEPVLQGVPDDAAETCELVLAEAMNNIVEHAYGDAQGGHLRLTVLRHSQTLTCRILDRGRPMPGLVVPDGIYPDQPDDSPAEGGYGWFLIHSLSQRLVYRRAGGMNLLLIVLPATMPTLAGDCFQI